MNVVISYQTKLSAQGKNMPNTHRIIIPSVITTDDRYPFKAGQPVEIVIDTKRKELRIRKVSARVQVGGMK